MTETGSSGYHITPANTPRLIDIPDPSDIDPFSKPSPHFTRFVAKKSKSFKLRKSIDGTFCDKQTTFALQNKIVERFTSEKLPDLKTTSDISSETFSLPCPELSSSVYSTSSVDDIVICESENSSKNSSAFSSQPVTHSYNLRSRPNRTSPSSSTRSTSISNPALLLQHAQPHSNTSEKIPSFLSDVQFH